MVRSASPSAGGSPQPAPSVRPGCGSPPRALSPTLRVGSQMLGQADGHKSSLASTIGGLSTASTYNASTIFGSGGPAVGSMVSSQPVSTAGSFRPSSDVTGGSFNVPPAAAFRHSSPGPTHGAFIAVSGGSLIVAAAGGSV